MSLSRRLASGTTQLSLGNLAVRLVSIAALPILTTLLEPQSYGVAALFGSAIALGTSVALAGIDMSYTRAYHSAQPPGGAMVEQYCWRFAIVAATFVAAGAAAVWWSAISPSGVLDRRLALLLLIAIPLAAAQTMAQTRARLYGQYRALATSLLVVGVVGPLSSIAIASVLRQDALALILPMLLGYLVSVSLLGVPRIKEFAKPSALSGNEKRTLLKIGLAGVVTAPLYWLMSASDRWFLQHFHGPEAVGVYAVGYAIAASGLVVNSAISSVWLPEVSKAYEDDPEHSQAILGKLMSRLIAVLAIVWLAVSAGGGDIVRWTTADGYHASTAYMPYIAGGVFFYGAFHLANTGLLIAKKLHWSALWWLIGGILSVSLNTALVPKLGGTGAAITQSVSFAFISLAVLASSQAFFRIQLDWARLALSIFLIVTAGLLMIPPWHPSAPASLAFKFPIGLAIAILVAWLAAPDWCAIAIRRCWRPFER